MGAFEYLSVLISIIIGLAITQLLTGFRGLLLARDRVRPYWPALVWAIVILMVSVQTWWSMFGLGDLKHWDFANFAIVLAQTIVLYMVAGLALPDPSAEGHIDLREHYYAHRRVFFGTLVALVGVSLAKDVIIHGYLPDKANFAFQAAFAVGAAGGVATSQEWYHRIAAPIGLVAFSAYIALLFSQLS
ncbi:MAG TPA: hypothetical protein VGI95_03775 [Caulobacteraceae bacterium]|jgi:hypothetical protein